jgi:hypothetical protein
MQFVDKALARRFEAAEEMPQVYHAQLDQVLRPQIGSAVKEICGGHMVFDGVGSPIGRAGGVGFAGTVTAADLDRIEAFYRAHGAPAQVDVCPLSDAGLMELLKARGYVLPSSTTCSTDGCMRVRPSRSHPPAFEQSRVMRRTHSQPCWPAVFSPPEMRPPIFAG